MLMFQQSRRPLLAQKSLYTQKVKTHVWAASYNPWNAGLPLLPGYGDRGKSRAKMSAAQMRSVIWDFCGHFHNFLLFSKFTLSRLWLLIPFSFSFLSGKGISPKQGIPPPCYWVASTIKALKLKIECVCGGVSFGKASNRFEEAAV